VIRLEFICQLPTVPVLGEELRISEMLEGGFFGPDLSRNFSLSVESGNVLRIQDRGQTLEHGRWYAIANVGLDRTQHFILHFPVLMGDATGDGTVSYADLAAISSGVPTFPVGDADRRDVNGDGAILFTDLAAARSHVPTPAPPRPAGH
jgi:hypothetical protein